MTALILDLRRAEATARQEAREAEGLKRLRLVGLADTLKAQAHSLSREG